MTAVAKKAFLGLVQLQVALAHAVVRHPMYSGALIMLAAIPLALGSVAGLAAVPFLVGALVARILDEERLLVSELAGYADYCGARRTPSDDTRSASAPGRRWTSRFPRPRPCSATAAA